MSERDRYDRARGAVVEAKKELVNDHRFLRAEDYPEGDAKGIVAALRQEEKNLLPDYGSGA